MTLQRELDGHSVKLSNLEKVLYPEVGFTKNDVINYYQNIAPTMIPHLSGRPLTLKRFPDGVDAEFFFEKQCPRYKPEWMSTITMDVEDGKRSVSFCTVDNAAALVWLANLAALELHANLQRAPLLDVPTAVVFDLDPGEPADIVQCCEVGLILKQTFEDLGLQSFAKTSGSKGLQVYLPMNTPGVDFGQSSQFALAIAEIVQKNHPELVLTNMKRSLRPGKILIDWSQNAKMKTTVAPYSLRAKPRPTVSTPVDWDEVQRCFDARDKTLMEFDADEVIARVAAKGDLFAPVLTLAQVIPGT